MILRGFLCIVLIYTALNLWTFGQLIEVQNIETREFDYRADSSFVLSANDRDIVVVVVPYRDRESHSKIFLEKFTTYAEGRAKLDEHPIDYHIVFSEQFDDFQFNRGLLFNAAFIEFEAKRNVTNSCLVNQDVDAIPYDPVELWNCDPPTHYSVNVDGRFDENNVMWQTNTGISLGMKGASWRQINGYANNYFGWGDEDNEIFDRMKANGFTNGDLPWRPSGEKGHFYSLNDATLRDRIIDFARTSSYQATSNGEPLWKTNGITSTKYFKAFSRPVEQIRDNMYVHWLAISVRDMAKLTNLPVYVKTSKCNSRANSLGTVPTSFESFLDTFECSKDVNVLLVNMTNGDTVLADSWSKLIRWLRAVETTPSAIILDDQKSLQFEPRDYPICIAYYGGKLSIDKGHFWCINDEGTLLLKVYHAEDLDLIRPQHKHLKICFNGSPIKFTIGDDCIGDNFTVRRGNELCFHEADQGDSIVPRGSCSHPSFFSSQIRDEKLISKSICTDSNGDSSFCENSDEYVLAAFGDWFDGPHIQICVREIDGNLFSTLCTSQSDTIRFSSRNQNDAWCLGKPAINKKLCLTKGSCTTSICKDGISIDPLQVNDIPFKLLNIRRDVMAKRAKMPSPKEATLPT